MTNLTNLSPSSSFGDVITCNNSGSGLTTVLQQIQDGLGHASTLQLATNKLNIVTSGAQFQIDGTALTATATQINNICALQIFAGTAGVTVPVGTTAQRPAIPSPGTIRLNTTTGFFEGHNGSNPN